MVGSIRVLLVDDDPPLADLMASRLEELRAELDVVVETDPNDALERFGSGDIDCIVSDYHMPEMNGIELLRCVREMDLDVPFMLFTAKGSEDIASEAVSEGVTDYFRKQRGDDQFHVIANRIENAVRRTQTELAIRRRERALRALSETVSEPVATPPETLLSIGCETLEIEYGAFCGVGEDSYTVLADTLDSEVSLLSNDTGRLSETLCSMPVSQRRTTDVTELEELGYADEHEQLTTYIGTPVYVADELYGTLSFRDREYRPAFSAWERAFVGLLGDWLGQRLTNDWARERRAETETLKNRLTNAKAALERNDDDTVMAELDAIAETLDRPPEPTVSVSIELQ